MAKVMPMPQVPLSAYLRFEWLRMLVMPQLLFWLVDAVFVLIKYLDGYGPHRNGHAKMF
jgi:hypothetical protein